MADDRQGDINLALIQMVQDARMLHDQAAIPSDYAAVYWIEAKCAVTRPAPTSRAGEWRAELRAAEVDAVWERVKAATVAGELGYKSKVSTGPAFGQARLDGRVICARTYDSADTADVARVKEALLGLGLANLRYVVI